MRLHHVLRFVLPRLLASCGGGAGPGDCEAGVRRRLAEALQVEPAQLGEITRDYSPGLFPGAVLYRARTVEGFHARDRVAGVVILAGDTLLVEELADLAPVWRRVSPDTVPEPLIASLAVRELLFQAGLMERGDDVIGSAAEITDAERVFLAPGDNLDAIQSPESHAGAGGLTLSFFASTSEGIVHYSAVASRGGILDLSREILAHRQLN